MLKEIVLCISWKITWVGLSYIYTSCKVHCRTKSSGSRVGRNKLYSLSYNLESFVTLAIDFEKMKSYKIDVIYFA